MARRILFLGDSLTSGYYASLRESSFAALVLERLTERDGEVERVTAAWPGGVTKVATYSDIPGGLDVAVVGLGTNDSLRTAPWVFARQYGDLLSRIRTSSPGAEVVCLGLWRSPWRAWPYDRAIERLAAKRGATYRPLSDLYVDAANRGPAGVPVEHGVSDDFHPNDRGHAQIAERVSGALRLRIA